MMRGKQKFCGGKIGKNKQETLTMRRAAKGQSRKGLIEDTAEDTRKGEEDEN